MSAIEGITPDPSLQGFLIQIGLTFGMWAVNTILFQYLSKQKRFRHIYFPRQKTKEVAHSFSYLVKSHALSDEYLKEHCGLDAFIILKFIRMLCSFFLIALIVPLILIPVNASNPTSILIGLDLLTIANISSGSRYWIHVILSYMVTLTLLYYLHDFFYSVVKWRQEYMMTTDKIHNRSLFVYGIPRSLRTDEALGSFFESLRIGAVVTATVNKISRNEIARITGRGEVADLYLRRKKVMRDLEYYLIEVGKRICEDDGLGGDAGGSEMGLLVRSRNTWGLILRYHAIIDEKYHPKLNIRIKGEKGTFLAIQHTLSLLHDLDTKITDIRRHKSQPSFTGFVTFQEKRVAHICSQLLIHPEPETLVVSLAPEPRDLMWQNLSLSSHNRNMRRLLVTVAVVALTFTWLLPMGVIVGIASLTNIHALFGGEEVFGGYTEYFRAFVQSVIPTLCVSAFMSLLPGILTGSILIFNT